MPTTPITKRPRRKRARGHTAPWPGRWRKAGCAAWTTPNNDLTEGTALRRLFGGQVPPFSSTKGYTGHALAAAGGIEAVLAVLAITHGLRYGNPGFAEPIPELGLHPVARTQEADVRSVLSNSFGFGGNCCSLIFAK